MEFEAASRGSIPLVRVKEAERVRFTLQPCPIVPTSPAGVAAHAAHPLAYAPAPHLPAFPKPERVVASAAGAMCQVYEREAILGRDAASVFPTETVANAKAQGLANAVQEGMGAVKFVTESQVRHAAASSLVAHAQRSARVEHAERALLSSVIATV
jgi:hypothetical protein